MVRKIVVILLAASLAAPFSGAQDFPEGPGKETFLRICSGCHEPVVVTDNKHSHDGWEELVGNMVGMGAQANDEEFAQIVDYLAKNFGTAKPRVNVNTSSAKDLSSGLGLTVAEGEAVVAYRAKNGNFAGVDDLKKVQGVDAAKIDAAKDRIVF